MAIFLLSRWLPATILDFDTGQKWRYGTLPTAHVYHHAKVGDNSSNGGRVIAFCGKIQNGGNRHFKFVFGIFIVKTTKRHFLGRKHAV